MIKNVIIPENRCESRRRCNILKSSIVRVIRSPVQSFIAFLRAEEFTADYLKHGKNILDTMKPSSLRNTLCFHMFQERFVIAGLKPVPTEEHYFKLSLKIFGCDPSAVVILQIARRMR
jgi:hypothetical protein